MDEAGEKKPPVGGLIDYRLLGQRHRVLGRLLAAREALQTAEFIAYNARLQRVGDALGRFLQGELDALMREMVSLVATEAASQPQPVGSSGSRPAMSPEQSPLG